MSLHADGIALARGLLGAADVGDGPTTEQLGIVQNLLHGYFGVDGDVGTLDPLEPSGLAAVCTDDAERRCIVDLLVVVEFCRHPGETAQADRVEAYARALGVDEPFLVVARDALTEGHERVMADWSRFREPLPSEPGMGAADPALAERLRALGSCPEGSLGRAYHDFLDRYGLAFPGEEGGGGADLVPHDFSHVLAGYDADAPGELALQAMLTSATGFAHHFSGLVASLSLYEAGKFEILDIAAKEEALDRPGAAAELADAFRRGEACTCDFSAIDHLARTDDPLDVVRADCGITPRAA
jgi:hypothetical protein